MSRPNKNRHTLLLASLAIGMFGFAFALVPLYEVFCEVTGINGKTATQAAFVDEVQRTEDREVTIELVARVNRGMPWEFRPVVEEIVVRPGEMNTTFFYARNRSEQHVIGQAVPSVSPGTAAQYLKKIECFCFEQQGLPAGGEVEMGVSFMLDADLPVDISKLTLSYRMFRVGDVEHEHVASHRELSR